MPKFRIAVILPWNMLMTGHKNIEPGISTGRTLTLKRSLCNVRARMRSLSIVTATNRYWTTRKNMLWSLTALPISTATRHFAASLFLLSFYFTFIIFILKPVSKTSQPWLSPIDTLIVQSHFLGEQNQEVRRTYQGDIGDFYCYLFILF